jgi:hypothetical protein
MIEFIYTYIKSLFIPTDIIISLNSSQIIFTREGDIRILPSRNIDTRGKYIFQNCTDEDINNIMYEDNLCLEQLEEEIL